MLEHKISAAAPSGQLGQCSPKTPSNGIARQSKTSNLKLPTEPLDDPDDMAVSAFEDEEASILIEPSISHVASRLKSPNTPAIEKVAAMEQLDGGGFFDSDQESPPAMNHNDQVLGDAVLYEQPTNVEDLEAADPHRSQTSSRKPGLHLDDMPSSIPEQPELPTPWHAGPKIMDVEQHQSSLASALGMNKSRSRAGSMDGLKKFLPSLPSMALVGNFFGSATSPKHISRDSSPSSDTRQNRTSRAATLSSYSPAPLSSAPRETVTVRPQISPRQDLRQSQRPQAIRRSTSNESFLYHSLSRASSLGDDARFVNQHEQVNSRAKAIRDSFQDRSSFRMPQIPSIPSMPNIPSLSFNMRFLNASNVPARWKTETNLGSDILQGPIAKKKPSRAINPHPAVSSGLIGAVISQPGVAVDTVKSANKGSPTAAFDRALEILTGDVVIMGGYRGSILRSAKTHRQVWVPVKVGLNIRKVDLEVGLEPEDEERMEESIYASGMLTNIGPVDISKRLLKRLNECENARSGKLRVWDYGYDWRLSPHLLAKRLRRFLERLPSNRPPKEGSANTSGALVIAHSLGGLITRHVVNQSPDLFSGVVYAGVPQACVNILGPLRNGDAVLLSSRVLTAQVNFTLRTSFVLLPEDGRCFFDIKTRENYPVDFFNIDDWLKYRWSPCTDPPLPPRNQQSASFGSILNLSLPSLSSLPSLPSLSSLPTLSSLPIPGKKSSPATSGPSSPGLPTHDSNGSDDNRTNGLPPTKVSRAADVVQTLDGGNDRTIAPQMGSNDNPVSKGQNTSQSVSTAVTIPRDKAIAYLKRTLAEIKQFKQELHCKPELEEANRYPPTALIYGKSIPTVFGAKVDGREGIACSDSYDNLAFASGDGVCLAKEAMLPPGYKAVYGGRVSSDRGHVTLLGDLNAVGRTIEAVMKGRAKGIGLGKT